MNADKTEAGNIEKRYDAGKMESKWSAFWLEKRVYHSTPEQGGQPYCVVIPPPNVTGILHIGHALNNTIQDILVRWRRMQGRNTVWIPGTDHAGIATQNVVERALAKEGKTRDDLGREAFVQRVWQWRKQYGNTIIEQLKRLGASCDWDRERFTMDEGLSAAVAEAFVHLYEKGLIYRGNYLVNWCPRCRTALSDEESEHVAERGKLYYIRYPVKGGGSRGGGHVCVATTRPETMLGDVAVAVNPADARYKKRVGARLILPILEREIPLITDDFVDPEFGTGAVKVTPAHDMNDFAIGQRHGLEPINVMNDDGAMNEAAGPYAGMDRFECRERLVEDLGKLGLIEKIDAHDHSVGHCYRCHTAVEPRLSLQWFVKMKPLAVKAIEAVREGRVTFTPERWTKVYLDWMENIRDWCISRQIWWGHRIPVYYCAQCKNEWAARQAPPKCPKCGSTEFEQDKDVLDTWFSSWLWPFSTLGWPSKNADLSFYYPTHDLVTASEIIFFWVARMITAGLEFMGDVPFRQVYIHGTVRDDQGRKMSKSLGNSIDPVSVISDLSADALRFSLMMITATGQDVYLSDDKFEIGRNFGTKLWNASRYILMHGTEPPAMDLRTPPVWKQALSPDDQRILYGLNQAIVQCGEYLERMRFNDYAAVLYDFVWHQYCDWYVEYSKAALYGKDEARREHVLRIMHHVLSVSLRLLHPVMPFITEELWHSMGYGKDGETISRAPWPAAMTDAEIEKWGISRKTVEFVGEKYEIIRAGRTLRADYSLPPSRKLDYIIKPGTAGAAEFLRSELESISTLLRAGNVEVELDFVPGKAMPCGVTGIGTIYMPIEDTVDVAAEVEKLTRQQQKIDEDLGRIAGKLANMDFVRKAPEQVVEQQKTRQKELLEKRDKLLRQIQALSG